MSKVTDADLANMSDDEILNLDVSQLQTEEVDTSAENSEETETTTAESENNGDDSEVADDTHATETETEGAANQNGESTDTEAESQDDGEDAESKGTDKAAKDQAKAGDEGTDGKQGDTKADAAVSQPADAAALKTFHDQITAPFKANGREFKVESAEEAVQLMQMGVNYNKKMAALKPNLTLMKMLQKADLLSEDKINFLIDLASKKPEAISKLVKDSGIDPLDITTEKAGEYQPGDYRITDEEQALDEVFEAMDGNKDFDRTLDVVGKQWDAKSRALIARHPQALHDITQHIRAGVFDAVMGKVDRERTFGRLSGLSDLEAYRQVGEAMATSGELEHLIGKASQKSQQAAPAKVVVDPNPQKADDDDRRKKRQAASSTRAAAPVSKLPADFNPLSMSDEELLKLDISKFR